MTMCTSHAISNFFFVKSTTLLIKTQSIDMNMKSKSINQNPIRH